MQQEKTDLHVCALIVFDIILCRCAFYVLHNKKCMIFFLEIKSAFLFVTALASCVPQRDNMI